MSKLHPKGKSNEENVIKQSKNVVAGSTVEAKGDISIGDHITNNNYYSVQETRKLSFRVFLIVLIVIITVIASLIYLNQDTNVPIEQTSTSSPTMMIKLQDITGETMMDQAGSILIEHGTLILEQQIGISGKVYFPNIPVLSKDDELQIMLKSTHYEVASPQRSFPVLDSTVLLVRRIAKTPIAAAQPIKKQKTFRVETLLPTAANLITKQLKAANLVLSKQVDKADFLIEVYYTGDLVEVHEGYYRYTGGALQIKVNGQLCCCNEQLKIETKGSRTGNKRAILEDRLVKNVNQLINQHIDDVTQAIKACIN